MRWPIQRVLNHARETTGWALVHAPIQSPHRMRLLADLRREGTRFVGMSSDTTFPRSKSRGPIDYTQLCEAWCHCSRAPEEFLPAAMPRIRLSLSDFVHAQEIVDLSRMVPSGAPFDFVHVTAAAPWKAEAKGWPLALRCLPMLCEELGLRGLVVGVHGSSVLSIRGVTWRPFLPRAEFLAALARARFLFVPNDADASPRVLAEALSLDVPLLMNRGILGGWHYLNRRTGVTFDGEKDVAVGALSCLAERTWRCRPWFEAHHGPRRSGTRLARLLSRLDPRLDRSQPLLLEGADANPGPR
jgi:hypothetical protein